MPYDNDRPASPRALRRASRGLLLTGLALAIGAPAASAQAEAGGVTPEAAAELKAESTTPAPSSSPSSTAVRTLKPGSRGARVRSLQRRLDVKVTGVYDRATKRAVTRFQKRRKLTADGIAGPVTLRALGLVPRSSSSRPTREPADVKLPSSIPERSMVLLELVAKCESGGRLDAVSPGGTYRGKYQFHLDTWASVGGSVDPIEASEEEQDKRAYVLFRRSGIRQWPVCGPKAAKERRELEAAASS